VTLAKRRARDARKAAQFAGGEGGGYFDFDEGGARKSNSNPRRLFPGAQVAGGSRVFARSEWLGEAFVYPLTCRQYDTAGSRPRAVVW
jgi:hypothetical protein